MTNETNLPPGVAEAMAICNREMGEIADNDLLTAWGWVRNYLLLVAAGRDELRARIEAAPVVALQLGGYGWLEMCDPDSGDLADLPDGMKGKRVRLVVEPDNG